MLSNRGFSGTLLLLILFLSLPLTSALGQIDVTAGIEGDMAEIGKDLVIQVTLAFPVGTQIVAETVEIKVIPRLDGDWLGDPYPLRSVDDRHFEWAASIGTGAQPQEASLTIEATATTTDGKTINGSGELTIQLDYGKEWNADRITNFITRRGIIPFLAVVFGFGLLMSLSPCIYPMIPITLAVIGASGQDKGPLQGLFKSFTYVLGMAFVYAILGALSATAATGLTAFLQSPAVLVPIALLMLALSFAMFGVLANGYVNPSFMNHWSGNQAIPRPFAIAKPL